MKVDQDYFDGMYAASPDPWDFTNRWYDRRKHQLTVASLPARHYRSAYEPACSIGTLSELLAPRCAALLASDAVEVAVEQARQRLSRHRHVRVERQAIPDDWPRESFDLIVLSEVLYYFDERQFAETTDRVRSSLAAGGDFVAVHWRRPVTEHRLTGDEVHERLATLAGFVRRARYRDGDFTLDVLTRTPPDARSVAQLEGLAE